MAKNLTIDQWITTIHLYKKMGIELAKNYYLTFSEFKHKYDLKKRIKKKAKLYEIYKLRLKKSLWFVRINYINGSEKKLAQIT
jgi:hypothetical protein